MSSFYRVNIILKHNYCWTTLTELFKDYNLQIDIVGTKICINTEQLEKIMLVKANNRSAVFSFLKEFKRSSSKRCVLGFFPLNKYKNLFLSIIRMEYRGCIDALIYEYNVIMQKQYVYDGFEHWLLIVPSKTTIKNLKLDIGRETLIKKLRVSLISPYELLAYFGKSEVLTSKEREAIFLSYHKGFLDWPRRENLDNLSQILGITKPTTLEHLRKGLKKLVFTSICMNYFDWYHILKDKQLIFS